MTIRRWRALAAAVALAFAMFAAAPAAAAPFYGTVSLSPTDYPLGVTPGELPLTSRLRFQLGRDGSVVSCSVIRTSGQLPIDVAGCTILQERARFRPERGRMRGEVDFVWQPETGSANNPRGSPLPFAFARRLSSADYPPEAMDARAQGTVHYRVEVSQNGLPRACTVTRSSGAVSLDARTCELVMQRGAFIAAADGRGGRSAGAFLGRINWRLP